MKQELLQRLDLIISSETSIKLHIDKIKEIRAQIEDFLDDSERTILNNRIKEKVQEEATQAISQAGGWGSIYNATGTGKSKIAINMIRSIFIQTKDYVPKVLIVVPTERLRDDNWKNEFDKWGISSLWPKVDRCCYVSLNKVSAEKYDLIVLDEGHNITDSNSEFFFENENSVRSCILLSATKPKNFEKLQILKKLHLEMKYSISVDEAVDLGLIAPYNITVVTMHLDSVEKYISGTKAKPELRTEKEKYKALTGAAWYSNNKFVLIERMRFIYNLRSKTRVAKLLLEYVIPIDKRTIIFCGSKDQAVELCPNRYFSKPTYVKPKKELSKAGEQKENLKMQKHMEMIAEYQGDEALNKFFNEEINRISCVNALNEGHDIPMVDIGFLVQVNGSEKDFIQRMGRALRFRPGHIGNLVVVVVLGTVDEEWFKKATKNINGANIRYVELARLRNGIETIDFNN